MRQNIERHCRIIEFVEYRRRPDQVDRPGFDAQLLNGTREGPDVFARHPGCDRRGHRGVGVEGDDLGLRVAVCPAQGPGTGSRTHVENTVDTGVVDVGGCCVHRGVEQLFVNTRVQIEQQAQCGRVPMRMLRLVGGQGLSVVVVHGSSVDPPCSIGIYSCL